MGVYGSDFYAGICASKRRLPLQIQIISVRTTYVKPLKLTGVFGFVARLLDKELI